MSTTPDNPKGLYSPRSWPSWFAFALVWALIHLPQRWLLRLSHLLAYPLKKVAARRRKIAEINLQTCFPELTPQQINTLVHQHFASALMGIFEMGMAWWLPDKALKHQLTIEGREHLEHALSKNKGVLLTSPHFTCLEIIGRLFKMNIEHPWSGMYRPHENPVIEHFFRRYRRGFFSNLIRRDDIRSFVKDLRKNQIVWYATDQNTRATTSINAPFFGTPTPSHTGTARIINMTGATVIPMSYHRRQDGSGYVIKFYPPPDNYPSGDDLQDATTINGLYETMILDATEQYFWLHRKFKMKDAETDIYRQRGL